jgi:3'-5' exonuclease
MHVYLDIETLPADWSPEQIEAHATTRLPGNYSKPETIAKWIAENAAEIHRATSLDGLHARVLCIGLAIGDDDPVEVLYSPTADAVDLSEMLYERLERIPHPVYVGHNVANFDLPMLRRMAWRAGHKRLARLFPSRPRSPQVIDTQELWAGSDSNRPRVKLSHLAAFFDAGDKGEGLDGSEVYGAWLRGEHQRIADYCRQDVQLVRNLLEAML